MQETKSWYTTQVIAIKQLDLKTMSENEVKESQKTVVAFIAGLLAGGLLVWIFTGSPEEASAPAVEEAAEVTEESMEVEMETAAIEAVIELSELPTGEAAVDVDSQPAGSVVRLNSATFPTDEGWVAVRSYSNGELGSILGAIQYSKAAGRVPSEIPLLAPTTASREYAIVFFSQDSNRAFNLDGDVQINTELITFTAE